MSQQIILFHSLIYGHSFQGHIQPKFCQDTSSSPKHLYCLGKASITHKIRLKPKWVSAFKEKNKTVRVSYLERIRIDVSGYVTFRTRSGAARPIYSSSKPS